MVSSALGFEYNAARFRVASSAVRIKPDVQRALFFAERMRPDYVYNAAALEGNPFTFPEVKTLLDGVTVGGRRVSDAEQVTNLSGAVSLVIERVKTDPESLLSQGFFEEVNGVVARNEALKWGVFRDGGVTIAGTRYLPPKATELSTVFTEMQVAVERVENPIERAFATFLSATLRQFFFDGNKRTARLVASGLLLAHGLPMLQIHASEQREYNEVLVDLYDTLNADVALSWLSRIYVAQLKREGFTP